MINWLPWSQYPQKSTNTAFTPYQFIMCRFSSHKSKASTLHLTPTQSRFHTSYFTTPNSLHFATPYMIDRVECIYMHISKLGSELDYFVRHHYIELKMLLCNMHIFRVGSDLLKRLSAYLDEVSMDSVCKYHSNLQSLLATKKAFSFYLNYLKFKAILSKGGSCKSRVHGSLSWW